MQERSLRNPRVAQIRGLSRQRKSREQARLIVIEGPKLIGEAMAAGLRLHDVVVESDGLGDPAVDACITDLQRADVDVSMVEDGGLGRLLPTKSPQPIVAVATMPDEVDAVPENATFVVAVEDLNDPGNAGTILRSSLAAGADAFVPLGGSVDVWSPKVIRSSAGAVFRLPIMTPQPVEAGLAGLRSAGLRLIGADGAAALDCTDASLDSPLALVMGNEAHGLSSEAVAELDDTVRIPLPGPVESLNVAMATAILSWEVCRQRAT